MRPLPGHASRLVAQASARSRRFLSFGLEPGSRRFHDIRIELNRLSASQDYSELVRRFYDAAIDDEAWAGAVGELKTQLNLTRVALGWFRSPPPPGELATQLLHSDCDLYFERLFAELGSANLFIPRMGLTRPGDLLTDRMLMRRDEFVRTTLYNEWFAPQDDHSAALINIESGSTAQAFLVAQRGGRQPQFTPRDEADMLALTPAPCLRHPPAARHRAAARARPRL